MRGSCRRFIGDSEGRLQLVVASHSREPVSQGHEVVMERSCEDSSCEVLMELQDL
jgi:hypothetical protein